MELLQKYTMNLLGYNMKGFMFIIGSVGGGGFYFYLLGWRED